MGYWNEVLKYYEVQEMEKSKWFLPFPTIFEVLYCQFCVSPVN